MNPMLKAALHYAEAGWPVFPCDPASKAPLVKGGFYAATIEPAQVRQFWDTYPNAAIGIRTGNGLGVVDIDPRNGGDPAFIEKFKLPPGPVVETGGGGLHYYYRVPDGTRGAKLDRVGHPGIDFKATGGYVIAPPSGHKSGRRYRWRPGEDPDNLPLPDLPPEFFALLSKAKESEPSTKDILSEKTISKGGRDQTLFRLASRLRAMGFEEPEILAAITSVNEGRCDPPFGTSTLARIARSASQRYEPEEDMEVYDAESFVEPTLLTFSQILEIEPPKVKWLLSGFIARGDVHLMAGSPGVGKSMVAMALSLAAAVGRPPLAHGEPGEPVSVLYIDAENNESTIINRLHGLIALMGLTRREQALAAENFRYIVGRSWATFSTRKAEARIRRSLAKHRPQLLVLDSFVALSSSTTENDAIEVRRFFTEKIFDIAKEYDATIIILHHTNKSAFIQRKDEHVEDAFKIRGSVDLLGAVDSWSLMVPESGGTGGLVLRSDKVRDGKAPKPLYLTKQANERAFLAEAVLAEFEKGPSEGGDDILSLLSEHPEGLSAVEVSAKTKIPKRTVLRRLEELINLGNIIKIQDGREVRYTCAFDSDMRQSVPTFE